jgi:hypothetical protein
MASTADLFRAIERRECILFLGAGVHYPPPDSSPEYQYPAEFRPPLGAQISRTLAAACRSNMLESARADRLDRNNKDERCKRAAEFREKRAYLSKNRDNLQRTSWFYELFHLRESLVKKIAEEVDEGTKPSAIVRALAELDFPIVITTNYDRIFEKALGLFGKQATTIIYDPERNNPSSYLSGLPKKGECWLYKIHGCVSEPKSIVITDEDYIHFIMRMNDPEEFKPIPQKIRTQLAEWPALFVGYSLLDYNLRLLFRTLRWRLHPASRPATFSLDLHPDLLIRAAYGALEGAGAKEPLVTFVARDIWKFVPNLYKDILKRDMPP